MLSDQMAMLRDAVRGVACPGGSGSWAPQFGVRVEESEDYSVFNTDEWQAEPDEQQALSIDGVLVISGRVLRTVKRIGYQPLTTWPRAFAVLLPHYWTEYGQDNVDYELDSIHLTGAEAAGKAIQLAVTPFLHDWVDSLLRERQYEEDKKQEQILRRALLREHGKDE